MDTHFHFLSNLHPLSLLCLIKVRNVWHGQTYTTAQLEHISESAVSQLMTQFKWDYELTGVDFFSFFQKQYYLELRWCLKKNHLKCKNLKNPELEFQGFKWAQTICQALQSYNGHRQLQATIGTYNMPGFAKLLQICVCTSLIHSMLSEN